MIDIIAAIRNNLIVIFIKYETGYGKTNHKKKVEIQITCHTISTSHLFNDD